MYLIDFWDQNEPEKLKERIITNQSSVISTAFYSFWDLSFYSEKKFYIHSFNVEMVQNNFNAK